MKKFFLIYFIVAIITYLNLLYCPIYAQDNLLSKEQQEEINFFSNNIEYLIAHKQIAKACSLAYEMTYRYPNEPDAYFLYAKSSYHAGYPDRAIEYYLKCIKLDKTYHQAFFNIGLIKYQQRNYKKAIKYYTKVINMTAKNSKYKYDNALAYSNRALAKYYNNNLKSALYDYNISLSIISDYTGVDHVYYNRGLCRYDLGDKRGADEDYKTAKSLNPKFKYIYYDKRE